MNILGNILQNIPLSPYTTFGIGGPAEYLIVAKDREALGAAVRFAKEHGLRVTVLGGGSNVLIADQGVKGLIIKNEIKGISYEETDDMVLVTAGAGVSWDALVQETVERGLWGLENLSGIPGTVGGGVVQNINAYGVTLADMVERVDVMHTQTLATTSFSNEACTFAYRNSFFKQEGEGKAYIVATVTIRLSKKPNVQSSYKSASQSMANYFHEHDITNPTPGDVRRAILAVRGRIGMLEGQYKSAGSFFTNVIVRREEFEDLERTVQQKYPKNAAHLSPWHWELPDGNIKVSAAFLMECTEFNKTAFKDKTFNDVVGISPVHTLSLVNVSAATAEDVHTFARMIQKKVADEFGVQLESEVCFL